mmetsp:Transcript_10879/g.34571  ORF Transcript_10879/g.34571 Transcript_10879/m.34571 type:complete len:259 (+) Transcript_10879:1326-2102(+)
MSRILKLFTEQGGRRRKVLKEGKDLLVVSASHLVKGRLNATDQPFAGRRELFVDRARLVWQRVGLRRPDELVSQQLVRSASFDEESAENAMAIVPQALNELRHVEHHRLGRQLTQRPHRILGYTLVAVVLGAENGQRDCRPRRRIVNEGPERRRVRTTGVRRRKPQHAVRHVSQRGGRLSRGPLEEVSSCLRRKARSHATRKGGRDGQSVTQHRLSRRRPRHLLTRRNLHIVGEARQVRAVQRVVPQADTFRLVVEKE